MYVYFFFKGGMKCFEDFQVKENSSRNFDFTNFNRRIQPVSRNCHEEYETDCNLCVFSKFELVFIKTQ